MILIKVNCYLVSQHCVVSKIPGPKKKRFKGAILSLKNICISVLKEYKFFNTQIQTLIAHINHYFQV